MRRMWAALGLAASLVACEGRKPYVDPLDETRTSPSDDHLAILDLEGGAPEAAQAALLGPQQAKSFSHLVVTLRESAREERVKGVLVQLGAGGIGFARGQELGALLGRFRQGGKRVVCHADDLGNATLMFTATGCDEIWLSPSGSVDAVGLSSQLLFARSLFDKLEVDVDFLQVGKYKGAQEMFTRDGPSPEARESVHGLMVSLRTTWIAEIEKGRGKKADALGLEDGPYTAPEALARGLVDKIGYAHEARTAALEALSLDNDVVHFGEGQRPAGGMEGLARALSGSGGAPYVALVRAVGAISMAPNRSPLGDAGGINVVELGKILRRLRKDQNAKAVVIRIDSPGGSALASDLLWKEIMRLRAEKPVVASVGGMAASGGYYLASAASKIVAEPTSIVGSIGVVGGKLSFRRAADELGIHAVAVAPREDRQNRALYGSPLEPWDEETRAKMLSVMQGIYDLFITRIAEGRGLEATLIMPSAEGRIMGGETAQKGKLVDELGGLDRSIDLAIELATLEADAPVNVVELQPGLLELLGGGGDEDDEESARRALGQALAGQLDPRAGLSDLARTMPGASELDLWAASWAPLFRGEKTVAALPFALSIR